jgi:hypothetical protein
MKDCELAWCAGFFDGEGSIHYYKLKNGARRIHMSLAQRADNNSLLYRFQIATGTGQICKSADGMGFLQTTKLDEIEKLLVLIGPWLGERKKYDFMSAIQAYKSHKVTEKKILCPNCKSEWNEVVCENCGVSNG